eukprot:s2851_g2.t1
MGGKAMVEEPHLPDLRKDEMVEQKEDQPGISTEKPAPVLVKEETLTETPAAEKEKETLTEGPAAEKQKNTLKETPTAEKQKDTSKETPTVEKQKDPEDEEPATEKVAEAKWMSDLKQDLEEKAEEEGTDLRRAQLKMRASEKGKLEEEREANKEKKKATSKQAPKPRGRPRRGEGEPEKTSSRKCKKGGEAEGEGKSAAAKSASKKRKAEKDEEMEGEGDQPQPKAKAKAKAKPKAGAKRAPRARGNLPEPDKVMEKEMFDLMRRYKNKPYDKETDVLHRVYTKKNSPKFYASIYFGRPAGGVKIVFPDGSETQKFYFSYAYSTVAVHIYACNKIISTFQNAEDGWWDGPEAQALFQLLLVTAGSVMSIRFAAAAAALLRVPLELFKLVEAGKSGAVERRIPRSPSRPPPARPRREDPTPRDEAPGEESVPEATEPEAPTGAMDGASQLQHLLAVARGMRPGSPEAQTAMQFLTYMQSNGLLPEGALGSSNAGGAVAGSRRETPAPSTTSEARPERSEPAEEPPGRDEPRRRRKRNEGDGDRTDRDRRRRPEHSRARSRRGTRRSEHG